VVERFSNEKNGAFDGSPIDALHFDLKDERIRPVQQNFRSGQRAPSRMQLKAGAPTNVAA
jgi:hypothetical protein